MPTKQQVLWVQQHIDIIETPVLDVGCRLPVRAEDSKVESYSLRPMFRAGEYAGLDMQAGEGVDIVCDLTSNAHGLGSYATVLLISVLEHVRQPWLMAANITTLLAPGGILFVSVPWVWRYHGHPHDYWRMSPHAVRALFPDFEFVRERSVIWQGAKQRGVRDEHGKPRFEIQLTRPYADRDYQTLYQVTVNMVLRKKA